ncbi:hypothetical protein GOODEAATRI_022924 [Goodea atripinnis]|uniref:Uncharacterized protein n=1 Tax=Goodea atripinnis TaxID=208336 RepID=A0ABV0MKD5_9TELE
MAAACSPWRSAPGGSTCATYPCVAVPEGGNYRGADDVLIIGQVCGLQSVLLQERDITFFSGTADIRQAALLNNYHLGIHEEDAKREFWFHLKKGTLKDYLGYFTATEPALIVQGRY